MRLLVVSQYFWPESFRINDICDGLVERGHEVEVLTSLPNVPQGRFYEGYGWFSRGEKRHNGVAVERVGVIERKKGSSLHLALNCASFAVNSLFHLPRLCRRGFDAVFVFNNSPVSKILPARLAARRMGVPCVVFVLDLWPESMFFLLDMPDDSPESLFKKVSRSVSRWLYKSADMLLISSRGFEPRLRDMGLETDIRYFPNYAERLPEPTGRFDREGLGIENDSFLIGFAGNVGKAQGLDLAVGATAAANCRCRWLIVGDGPELTALKEQVERAGLADRFTFTGWVESALVPEYLALCDAAFLSLKDRDILNLVVPAKLQTYMYAALPVLGAMNGAGAGLITDCGCGIAAPAEKVEELAAAIERMAALTPDERAEMGRRGRDYCDANFDRDRLLDALCGDLRDAVSDYEDKKWKK